MTCHDTCCTGERIESVLMFERSHRARKQHPCASCRQGIRPGEMYRVQGWRVDGDFYVVKEHPGDGVCGAYDGED